MRYPITFILLVFCGTLFGQSADFSFRSASGGFCVPAPVLFTQEAGSGAIGFIWDFGDGSTSNDPNPGHTFQSEGIFNVHLTAIFPNSTKEIVKQVEINPANKVSIKAQWSSMCQTGDALFTATGNNMMNFEWDFDDGTKLATGDETVTHNFKDYKNYNVKVRATDNQGCVSSAATGLKIAKPEITVKHSSLNFCVGVDIDFKSTVKLPSQSKVVSYTWDFGDGNSAVTTTGNISHPYADKDEYAPTLSIVTSDGCTADLAMEHVFVGVPTSLKSASVLDDEVCASDPAHFLAASDDADFYIWVFDGSGSEKTTKTDLPHKFNSLGIHSAVVYPYDNNGCAGDPLDVQVNIIGVIAGFDFKFDCDKPGLVNFLNQSQGNVTSFLWDFGDGTQNSTDYNPSYTLMPDNSFDIRLDVHDAVTGCSYTTQKTISTVPSTFQNDDDSICINQETRYSMGNFNENILTTYTYSLLGEQLSPVKNKSISHSPEKVGVFQDFVIVDNGPQFCPEKVFLDHRMIVRGPELDFDLQSDICMGDSIAVINKSHPFLLTDFRIKTFSWSVNDDIVSTEEQPSPWYFSKAGDYKIKLFAEDIVGCFDTLTKVVSLHNLPFLRIVHESDQLCEGSSDQLTVFHNDPVTWSSNEALPCHDCDAMEVFPTADAYYAAETWSKDGCVSKDTVFLKVFNDFKATALNPNTSICIGDTVSLFVEPLNLNVTWLPGDNLSATTGYSPVASPVVTTQYTAILTDDGGCFTDEVTFNVTVNPPAVVDIFSDTTVPYLSNFKLEPVYSNNIVRYEWSPRGDLNCISCPSPGGIANDGYTYIVQATTDQGCITEDSVTVFIECADDGILMPSAFTPNNDNLNDVFYPIGRGVSTVRKFTVFDRYGQVVFHRENFLPNRKDYGWNGRIKGEPAPSSVYIFIIEAECGKGDKIVKKGTVSLIR